MLQSASAPLSTPAAGTTTDWPEDMLVLVPVYNHVGQVGQVVSDALALGAPVLVVDDGSTDGSGAAAAHAGAEVITLPENRGKAAALRVGLLEGERRGYRQVLTCDADGQHPTSEVARLAAAGRGQTDLLLIGQRDMTGAPLVSRIGRFFSNLSCRIISGTWPGDSQSGLRIYPVPAINRLDVPARRYAFEVEVLVRAVWSGVRLHPIHVAVLYPADRISHFNKCRDNLQATTVFLRLLVRRLLPWGHKPRLADGEAACAEETGA